MKKPFLLQVLSGFMFLLLTGSLQAQEKDLFEMSFEELLNIDIVSASNKSEKLSEAPATVIVITRDDMRERGYSQVSDMLDDLPGMQVSRPYGDTHMKNYWRGYRNSIGEPFLVMIDGMVFNHLYFNTADIPLTVIPMSNIDRVEVVYGPASSVYGPNAFMGVINIITIKDRPESGSFLTANTSLTTNTNVNAAGHKSGLDLDHYTKIVDATYFYKKDDLRISLSARIENGFIDERFINNYEFTKNHYYQDRRIWGGFVDNANLGGQFESGIRNRSVDFRAYLGNTELGAQYYVLDAGYGLAYPGDEAQNNSVWKRPEYSLYLKNSHEFSRNFSSRSLLRYRQSDVSNDSYFIDGYWAANDKDAVRDSSDYVAAFSYWQSLNYSWSVFQDFDLKVSDQLSLSAGVKYEQKNLQKAYDINGENAQYSGLPGSYVPVSGLDPATYLFPQPPSAANQNANRITTEDVGVYAQGRYRYTDNHIFNVGFRLDRNSQYGIAPTIRAGYVGNYNEFTVKALFGQAFQEPTPRLLYGGWSGSGSDPDLKPEKSQTVELSIGRTTKNLSSGVSLYWVENKKTIVNTSLGAKNLGDRTVIGSDINSQALIPIKGLKQFRAWSYVSLLFKADEKEFVENGAHEIVDTKTTRIGDLSNLRWQLGTTVTINAHVSATLLSRYVGERKTVKSNPVNDVPAYFAIDTHAEYRDFCTKGLRVALRIRNLLNASYAHPGIREASAGTTPGTFDGNLDYQGGSKSFFNSEMPQPGRTIMLSFSFDY